MAAHKQPSAAEAGNWVIDGPFASAWQPTEAERQPLPIALNLYSLYDQLLRSLLPQAARPGQSLPEQVERLTRLRSRQNDYNKLEARLHREKLFDRKEAFNAESRDIGTEIDQLSV